MTESKPLLAEYALSDDASEIEALLAEDPELRAELDALTEAAHGLALTLTPVPPPPALKARLLASVAAERHLPFLATVARFADLALEKMRGILKTIDDPQAWEELLPGMHVIHFDPGPAMAGADTGFLRLEGGVRFPKHKHHAPEVTVVLEGELIDSDGSHYGPGDVFHKGEGDPHDYAAGPDGLLIFTAHYGFEILFDE